jgi:hypothetical protein
MTMSKNLVHTALSPAECRARIAAAIDAEEAGRTGLPGFVRPPGSKPVTGTVDEKGFVIQTRIEYRNSFKTYLWGRFIPANSGTQIELKAGLQPGVVAFMRLWMTGALILSLLMVAGAIGAYWAGHWQAAIPLGAFAVFFPLLSVAIVRMGRWIARGDEPVLIQFICDQVEAR